MYMATQGGLPEPAAIPSVLDDPPFLLISPISKLQEYDFACPSQPEPTPAVYPQQLDPPAMLVPTDSLKTQVNGWDSETTSTCEKRSLPDPGAAPLAKRAKSNTSEEATISTASRRVYKKRQPDGGITQVDSASSVILLIHDPNPGPITHIIPELQVASCQSSRYKHEPFTRCVACIRRDGGDTCRFQGIRYIMRDENQKFVGIAFNEHRELIETCKLKFPTKWNRKLDREHIQRSKLSMAKALLPTLKMEQEHVSTGDIIRRQRETVVRVTCDACITSLFSTSFMCRRCGREVCNDCFQFVMELTRPEDELTRSRRKSREKDAHPNPFLLSCSRRNDPHNFTDFTPVTRFAQSELNRAVGEMQCILDNAEGTEVRLETTPPQSDGRTYADVINDPLFTTFPDPITSPIYDDFTPANTPSHVTSIPIHRAQIIPASFYDPPSSNCPRKAFSSLWERGIPLLVKDVLPRFKLTWNPEYFIKNYGDERCNIIECQSELTRSVCIREFFEWFGKYENRTECWKLKDWPPTADFKNTFPELFDDFSNAVPVPDYVRRDGVYNIGSHFPSGALAPDLGPKMYNSMASSQEAGSQGSTRLHMDMADAINVMLYASNCADGSPGYAVWDLFRAEDSDKIRDFLRKRLTPHPAAMSKGQQQQESQTQPEKAFFFIPGITADHDPIHIQRFYLDVELRRQLWAEYEVKSYRIYQRPGEGVFIPAGCAHQVANMSDCIKIAVDFVSPENIDRCEKLTKEFREQNQRKAWKEDVLQLRTMMWFAWQSCSKREVELSEEDGQDRVSEVRAP